MTMPPSWHFRRLRQGEKIRNPIQGEYFSEEAIERPAQALVREAIQNSLDARADEGPIRIRFFVSGSEAALSAEQSRFWFSGAWPHFRAQGSGLSAQLPPQPPGCSFLAVEDFGTTGLCGDPTEWRPPTSSEQNRFFAFFRAEGLSGKEGQRGGRWGVGKTVFPRSSATNSFFGLTVRQDDGRALLMGQAVLLHHRYEEHPYTPDGGFGILDGNELVLPVEDSDLIGRFSREFRLTRDREAGLSVVVPFADPEITAESIVEAVVREYFFPIMAGRLTIVVEAGSGFRLVIEADSIRSVLASLSERCREDIKPVIEMTEWVLESGGREARTLLVGDGDEPPQWRRGLFPDRDFEDLARAFREGCRLAIRVPVLVRPTRGEKRASFFDLYLRRDLGDRGYPPVYIRNGIIIPARQRRVRGHKIHVLTVIDDAPLASLLGDAETPAHTHWSKDTRNFKGKYHHGKAVIDFVVDAPRRVAEILGAAGQERDRAILADFFPRPPVEGGVEEAGEETGADRGAAASIRSAILGVPSAPPFCVIDRVDGGFTVRDHPENESPPRVVTIRVAYDRTTGSPLKKHRPEDFRLRDLHVETAGCAISWQGENVLVLGRLERGFRLHATGFDPHRDLFVQVERGDA